MEIEDKKTGGSEAVNASKPAEAKVVNKESSGTAAPIEEKPVVPESSNAAEAPEAKDIDEVLEILNAMDKLSGGKGGLTEVPAALKGSVGFLIEKLKFVRDMFEDPMWKSIMDDLADQKEDGQTPSVEVAVARSIPLEKLQELADTEDYAGAQTQLSNDLANKKSIEEEDAMYAESFERMQNDAAAYAEEMGYDEARKNQLLQKIFDILKMVGDGKLSKVEMAEFDKMLNYDTDIANLQEQVSTQPAKEVLPDQASIDTASSITKQPTKRKQSSAPGLDSMVATGTPEYLRPGKRYGK